MNARTPAAVNTLDDAELYRVACKAALALPHAEMYDFARGWEAARVHGKWFMLATVRDETRLVSMKAHPDDVQALTHEFAAVQPGYHLNKRHWITVLPNADADERLVTALVLESYLAVVAKLPKRDRPADLGAFASSLRAELLE
ncbi:MmcQ/YjbR family DNA-binding protein [Berryella wangjianweii]|nr:MmcQ/YjbR family DNA-binding protein [Berryella wangjianweii]